MKTTAKRRTKTGVAGARLGAALLALAAVTAIGVTDGIAQNKRDLELGSLPPAPDLRQDSEKTFKERMKARRSAIQQQEAEKRLAPKAPKGPKPEDEDTAMAKRLSDLEKQKRPLPPMDPNAPSPSFTTPSGYQLKSFDNPEFWQGEAAPIPEQPLASLPAMPDLRTDTDKTWIERYREKQDKIKQVKEAREQIIAERAEQQRLGAEVARQKALEAANRPQMEEPVYYAYNGPAIQAETPTGKSLKAFNSKARYVQDQ
ncbi:MAG: hypothetical protein KDL87_15085, partial [Verrucomicrobiae bacterium]|nr:hypothetical protein [Verrucomicrobiae bacterium]